MGSNPAKRTTIEVRESPLITCQRAFSLGDVCKFYIFVSPVSLWPSRPSQLSWPLTAFGFPPCGNILCKGKRQRSKSNGYND